MKKIKCEICGFEIQAANLRRHIASCKGLGPVRQRPKDPTLGYVCSVCGKVFNPEEKQAYCGHKSHCGKSLVARNISEDGRKRQGWSRGLTKETDSRIKKYAESLKGKTHLGHPHTQESRDKMSLSRCKYIQRSGGNVPYYDVQCGDQIVKVQGSWERRIAEKLNSMGIRWERRVIRFDKIRRYTPDFFLIDLGVFLEVKGLLKKNDIDKMSKALKDNPEIDLRMLWKLPAVEKFEAEGKIQEIPRFKDIMAH
jgi:rubredoxin